MDNSVERNHEWACRFLIALGVLALTGLALTGMNYYLAQEILVWVTVDLEYVEIRGDSADVCFTIQNASRSCIVFDRFEFRLYLNNEFVASNQERDIRESIDPGRTVRISQVLGVGDAYSDLIRATPLGERLWMARGRLRLIDEKGDLTRFLPFKADCRAAKE